MKDRKMNWKLKRAEEDEVFPYVVYELTDEQQIMQYSGRSFASEQEAFAVAKALNIGGKNVIVFKELGYCLYTGFDQFNLRTR